MVIFIRNYDETTIFFCILEECAESIDDLKECITLYGPYKMAKILYSLDILNSTRFSILSNLKLSKVHLASVLVDQLLQAMKERKKYVAFLDLLKREPSLVHVYYKMSFLSKSKFCSYTYAS